MITCPEGWHPDADQRDGPFDLAGYMMKVDPHLGDILVVATCYCGYPRLGHMTNVRFEAGGKVLATATFQADDAWGWPWGEDEA